MHCGPHWLLMENLGAQQGGSSASEQEDSEHFEVKLPVYEPSVALTAVLFLEPRRALGAMRAAPKAVCKLQVLLGMMPLSKVRPGCLAHPRAPVPGAFAEP